MYGCGYVGVYVSTIRHKNHWKYHYQTWQLYSTRQVLVNIVSDGDPDSFVDPGSLSNDVGCRQNISEMWSVT